MHHILSGMYLGGVPIGDHHGLGAGQGVRARLSEQGTETRPYEINGDDGVKGSKEEDQRRPRNRSS